jgi:sigma-B regulation protein RsbU (phosphoserine phosphatase)
MDDWPMQERYRALLQSARNLLALTSMEDLVENILKYSRTMMHAEACSMYLPDRARRQLIIYSARGKEDAINEMRIPWDKGVAGMVFQQRKFVRIDDAQNDQRILRTADLKTGFTTRAMLCAPLVDKNDCFGVLQALNPVGRPNFTELDEDIFDGLTAILTGALVRFDRELKIEGEVKLAQELALAVEIQRSYLPPETIRLPRAELRVRYRPARTIGGDFYASLALPDDRILVALGDVSGKGIPAALTTAQITSEIQALAPIAEEGLTAYVTALNEALCRRLAAGRFAATTFLLHNPGAGTMEIVCAGQFRPWRWRNDSWEEIDVVPTLALGIFKGHRFEATTVPCGSGEKWLLFSDGINEGRSPTGEDYGLERLQSSLGGGCIDTVIEKIWQDWESFIDGEHQHDDACLALLVTKPAPVLEIDSAACNCKRARIFIEEWAQAAGFPDLERGRIVLAADEATTNIIRHTYAGRPGSPITLTAALTEGMLHLRLRDFGPPVDLAQLKGRELDDVRPGGLGLMLLHSTFDAVEHTALPDGNEWHLARRLHPAPLPVPA